MGRPLAAASAAFTAGVWLGLCALRVRHVSLSSLSIGAAVAAGLAALGWMARRHRDSPARSALLWVLCLCLGLLRAAIAGPVPAAPGLDEVADRPSRGAREPVPVALEILSVQRVPGALTAVAELHALPGRPKLLLRAEPEADLHRGDRLQAMVSLRRPPRALNPGERDRRAQLALAGIALEGTATELQLLSRGPRLWAAVDRFRASFSQWAQERCATPGRGALVAALAVGDRSSLLPEDELALSQSGLVHLLASSGLHAAVAGALVALLVGWCWRRTRLSASLPAAAAGAWVAIPAVAAQGFLLGLPWAACRASLAAALAFGGLGALRKADSTTGLCASLAACVAAAPQAAADLGLQLAALGIAGLIVLSGPVRELLPAWPGQGLGRWALAHWVAAAASTAAATAATAPLLLTVFHRAPLAAIPANALGLLPGLAAIPFAGAAALLHQVAPQLALVPLWAADRLSGVTLAAAQLFEGARWADPWMRAPSWAEAALWLSALLLFAGAPEALGAGGAADRPARRLRIRRAALPLGTLATLLIAKQLSAAGRPQLQLWFLGVGQGDSTLIQFPGGVTWLVDAGGDLRDLPFPLGQGHLDPGRRAILPALAELGVHRIDRLILTHPHPDHAGGMASLLTDLPVGELWVTGEPGPHGIGDRVAAFARAQGVPVVIAHPLVERIGRVQVELVHPDPSWAPDRSTNDNSIALRLTDGRASFLLAGDLEALGEAELAYGARPLQSVVLKAGHHGSRTSTTDSFLRRVRPRWVVFSEGVDNGFGFPHPEVVRRVADSGAAALRTDGGAVRMQSDGLRLTVAQFSFEDGRGDFRPLATTDLPAAR